MNRFITKTRLSALSLLGAVAFTLAAARATAQDTTTTHTRPGVSQYSADVRNAEIVYVEGNDLVLKLEDGKIEHMVVPSNEKFTIDGKKVTVNQLRPGTRLTQTIVTTTTPHYVKTIRVLKGKVWHVNAPHSVIVTLPEGKNQLYKVPSHAKFTIEGKSMTVFDLKKGMTFEATIVTDDEHTVIEQTKSSLAYAPPPTPLFMDVMLFQEARLPASPVASVTATHVDPPTEIASSLPETASPLPLLGLLGGLGIASSAGIGFARKRVAGKL